MLEFLYDRDTWIAKRITSIVMAIIGLFFLSMFMSCQELRYMVSAKTTEVQVSVRPETIVVKGRQIKHLVAGYMYADGAENRSKYVSKPLDWPGADIKTATIQYVPGRDMSRFLGESNRIWVTVFFGSIVLAGIGIFILVKSG